MSRNNLPASEQALVQPAATAPGKLVRAVHAVAMRWAVEGTPVADILRENPAQSLQEFTAQLHVRNAMEAKPGTKEAREAAKALRLLIDGNDDPAFGMVVPVTYTHKLRNDNTQEKEVAVTIPTRMQLQEENNG